MAKAEQIKALVKSHLEGDVEHFCTVALQIAAREAKLGHGKFATELRKLVDLTKEKTNLPLSGEQNPIPIIRPPGELAELLSVSYPKNKLSDMVLGKTTKSDLRRIIQEQRHASEILLHGLQPQRKVLLVGPPGTGKTMTASALAGELGLPLLQVRLDGLITKYMGETAAKLRQIFDTTSKTRGIYLFDEFDAIGSQRGLTNDIGEARRILNSFLLMIDHDCSHSLIIAATNHPRILDIALFRRFDNVIHYELPDQEQIMLLLKTYLSSKTTENFPWEKAAKDAQGLSYAEIKKVINEVLKQSILNNKKKLFHLNDIRTILCERKQSIELLTSITDSK